MLSGRACGGIADGLRLGKSDVAGEGDEEAEVDGAARVLDGAGEAVQDATEASLTPMAIQQVERVVPCGGIAGAGALRGAAVDDDRQAVAGCAAPSAR